MHAEGIGDRAGLAFSGHLLKPDDIRIDGPYRFDDGAQISSPGEIVGAGSRVALAVSNADVVGEHRQRGIRAGRWQGRISDALCRLTAQSQEPRKDDDDELAKSNDAPSLRIIQEP